jgi:hypothetical protein
MGLIFGILGLKSSRKGLAKTGIALSIIAPIVGTLILIFFTGFLNVMVKEEMSRVRIVAESYFEENNTYVGLEDEPEIKKIGETLKDSLEEDLFIGASDKEYCAKIKLSNESWMCTDVSDEPTEYQNEPACSYTHSSCK